MTTPAASSPPSPTDLATGAWRVDAARSRVTFRVRFLYGLTTVKGHFDCYFGVIDLSSEPALVLNIDAASLNTKNANRDERLRSGDFFDVERHPEVRFISDSVVLRGETLEVRGQLHAAGRRLPLAFDATVGVAEGELEIEACTRADHRELGMTWSPFGTLLAPSKLTVRARLTRDTGQWQMRTRRASRDR